MLLLEESLRELATRGRDRGAKKKEWPGYYGTRRLLAHEEGEGALTNFPSPWRAGCRLGED